MVFLSRSLTYTVYYVVIELFLMNALITQAKRTQQNIKHSTSCYATITTVIVTEKVCISFV